MPIKNGKIDIIVFGVGQTFYLLRSYLNDNFNIVAFADNDVEKQGVMLDNILIIDPIHIVDIKFDRIIITTTGFQKNVVKQLIELGVDKNHIILGVNFLMMNNQGNTFEYYIDENSDIQFRYNISRGTIITIEQNDFKWLISTKDAVITPSVITDGGFSQKELDLFFCLAKKYFGETQGIFLDVGANIGTTSLAATKYSQVIEVIAIEPSSENFSLLQCNIYLNKLHNKIRGINAVCSDKNGIANLLISPVLPSDNRVINKNNKEGANVESIVSLTIDSIVKNIENKISFMWIDVQGYEYYVLSGAKNLISRSKNLALYIEFWPSGLKETNSLDLLCQFCKKNFTKFIDIKECIDGIIIVHDIVKIDFLSVKYQKTHTDLFLI